MKTKSEKFPDTKPTPRKQYPLSLVVTGVISVVLVALSQVCGNFPVEVLLGNQPANHMSHRVGCIIARMLGIEVGDLSAKQFPSEHGGPNGLQVTVRVRKGIAAAETIGGIIERLTSAVMVMPDIPEWRLELKRVAQIVETPGEPTNKLTVSNFEEYTFAFSVSIGPPSLISDSGKTAADLKVAEVDGTSAAASAA